MLDFDDIGPKWPDWAILRNEPKIDINTLRQIYDGKREMSALEYIKEHFDDKPRKKYVGILQVQ